MQNSIFETLPLEEEFDFPLVVGLGENEPPIEINPTRMRKKNPALISKQLNTNYREDGTTYEPAGAGFRGFEPIWSIIAESAQSNGWVAHAELATDLESVAFIKNKAVARCAYRLTLDLHGDIEDTENDQPFSSVVDVTVDIKNYYLDPAPWCFEDLRSSLAEHIRISIAKALDPISIVLPETLFITLKTTYSSSNQLNSGFVKLLSSMLANELREEILENTDMGKTCDVIITGSSWGLKAVEDLQNDDEEDESAPMSMAA